MRPMAADQENPSRTGPGLRASPMDRDELRRLDLAHVWHPYTQSADLAASDFPVIVRAEGRRLFDADGTAYWDGTASMWLNVHGHRVPEIDAAIVAQLGKVAHATLLGQASAPAVELAHRLATASGLPRVFYSDNGSTAVESAIKMALQCWAQRGRPEKRRIASFDGAYHGDTLGAIAAAPVPAFHSAFEKVLPAPPVRLPWPDMTRGPHRGDAAATWEWALGEAGRVLQRHRGELAAVLVEPLVQVVGGVRVMPPGYLRGLADLCAGTDVLLILDEVATGFGRTGTMFAYQQEGIRPDLVALGKGITGGYLPLAATLATEEVHDAFLGTYADRKAFYHGHSYSGNALGCAAGLASLDLLERLLPHLPEKARWLDRRLGPFRSIPHVGEVRQCGFLVGFDLVRDPASMEPFPWQTRAAWSVYLEAKRRGLLARPYASTGLLVPPLASTREELDAMLAIYEAALWAAQPDLERLARESWPPLVEVPA
jgi:adenosylmethionine-8-amino-7-oxononanoate transaminase